MPPVGPRLNAPVVPEPNAPGYFGAPTEVPCLESRPGGALQFGLESIVGESDAIRDALERARKVASSRLTTVLVVGETGTGKELVARRIHTKAHRRGEPFVERELRRDPRDPAGERAVRPRARRVHRRASADRAGLVRAARRRHAVPRRDRRAAAAPAGQAAARARGAQRAPLGGLQEIADRRAGSSRRPTRSLHDAVARLDSARICTTG